MARKRRRSRWDYLIWAGGLLGLGVLAWLGWQILAPASSTSQRAGCSIALVVFLLLVFGPEVFEISARRAIRRDRETEGEVVVKIESRSTYYKVSIQSGADIVSRKCFVHGGEVKWIS